MSRKALSMAVLFASTALGLASGANAQEYQDENMVAQTDPAEALPPDYGPPDQAAAAEGPAPPIPPYVDEPPVPAQSGGYCFEGPHPVDSRVEPGVTWDGTTGRHLHGYPPFDLRLFSFENGCYYFIGDPTDFGYAGETYSYYGAHPILAAYGGGWCFMIGPHHHFWRPWSSLFVTVGPWFYWQGPYDPFFWTYWPFYHYYYRHHYPSYYSHGAFFNRHAVAPRITSVPRPMGRGAGWSGASASGRPLRGAFPSRVGAGAPGTMREGVPAPGARGGITAPGTVRGGAPGAFRGSPGTFRGAPVTPQSPGMFRGSPAIPRGGVGAPSGGGFAPRGFSPPAPRNFSPPASRSFSPPANFGGGARFGGGGGGARFGGGGGGARFGGGGGGARFGGGGRR